MKNNTPELWDEIWRKHALHNSQEQDALTLAKEERGIRWQRMEQVAVQTFGSFENLNVIEIGSGTGTNAALMAKRGARVTVLDYSMTALRQSKAFFERLGLSAEVLQHDALALPESMLGRYDIAMSFGLAEHFKGVDRTRIIQAHFDLVRKRGLVFISVPNAYNPPYRISKFLAERTGRWAWGEEYPFSRGELKAICRSLGITAYHFFGESLLSSLIWIDFLNPLRIIHARRPHPIAVLSNAASCRKERGTILDAYFSYALVLCGRAP